MSPANGHAHGTALDQPTPAFPVVTQQQSFSADQIKSLILKLEMPFDPSVIEWRVINTAKNGPRRGQVIPYADQRTYTDRLNALLTPAGWTREYTIHTSPNFERSKDQKTVAKIVVTCKVTIFGLGSHSSTGEAWADDPNGVTSAEAQSFKRACACVGLGRYLYYFSGVWVDLDDHKRPKRVPKLPQWAMPEGWQQGLRPQQNAAIPEEPAFSPQTGALAKHASASNGDARALIHQIEEIEKRIGKGLFRGLLKQAGHAWRPDQIKDSTTLARVLALMQSAERGMGRLNAATGITGPDVLRAILHHLKLRSLDDVRTLDTLKKIVLAAEEATDRKR